MDKNTNTYQVSIENQLTDEEYEAYFKQEIDKYKNTVRYESKLGYEFFRRVVDIIFSVVAFIPVTLLIAILSIIIVLNSKGNPIFTQVRVGKDGKLIKIRKLRSMYTDAEANGQQWAVENDDRITSVGKVLRKYRLDEIPQFYSVLTGTLSLIGPRPETPALTKKFHEETPGFVTRLMVKPGLSGWAQINGGYNITYQEKVKFDNEYIENRSIGLYLKIFMRTLGVVSSGEDAL